VQTALDVDDLKYAVKLFVDTLTKDMIERKEFDDVAKSIQEISYKVVDLQIPIQHLKDLSTEKLAELEEEEEKGSLDKKQKEAIGVIEVVVGAVGMLCSLAAGAMGRLALARVLFTSSASLVGTGIKTMDDAKKIFAQLRQVLEHTKEKMKDMEESLGKLSESINTLYEDLTKEWKELKEMALHILNEKNLAALFNDMEKNEENANKLKNAFTKSIKDLDKLISEIAPKED
jgi:methyl-accepting chemotaxis protein